LKVIVSNAHWFWFCASSHDMSRKLLIEISMLLYWTFWVQVLLKFLISDDEFNKELVKSNAFMFFDSDSIEISDFESRFFFRNFWFLSSFLSRSSLEISDFYQAFWAWVLILLSKFLVSTSDLNCVACFYIVYTLIARLMSFELMLWVCIKRIIWMYSN